MRAVDTSGQVRGKYCTDGMYRFEAATPAQDKTGSVFINYNPGRYNVVIILLSVANGFDDLQTLLVPGQYDGRFYYADVVGPEANGNFAIKKSTNDCRPSCADGKVTSKVYRWDGQNYRVS